MSKYLDDDGLTDWERQYNEVYAEEAQKRGLCLEPDEVLDEGLEREIHNAVIEQIGADPDSQG